MSVVLCNWDLNNRRMLHFSPDPYRRLVLELFSTASCSVCLLLGEEGNKRTHISNAGCPPHWQFTRNTKVTLNLSKMKPDCSNALIKTALSRSVRTDVLSAEVNSRMLQGSSSLHLHRFGCVCIGKFKVCLTHLGDDPARCSPRLYC